jgi:hypothetical protein
MMEKASLFQAEAGLNYNLHHPGLPLTAPTTDVGDDADNEYDLEDDYEHDDYVRGMLV